MQHKYKKNTNTKKLTCNLWEHCNGQRQLPRPSPLTQSSPLPCRSGQQQMVSKTAKRRCRIQAVNNFDLKAKAKAKALAEAKAN